MGSPFKVLAWIYLVIESLALSSLQSRNAAVVITTAQLFHHCAPRPEIQVVAKAMIRLLRSHTEVQVTFSGQPSLFL